MDDKDKVEVIKFLNQLSGLAMGTWRDKYEVTVKLNQKDKEVSLIISIRDYSSTLEKDKFMSIL